MLLASDRQAIPWEFTTQEATAIQEALNSSLLHAYLQSLKYLALENKLVPPEMNATDILASNAYMSGQEYILSSLLSPKAFVPLIKTNTKGE